MDERWARDNFQRASVDAIGFWERYFATEALRMMDERDTAIHHLQWLVKLTVDEQEWSLERWEAVKAFLASLPTNSEATDG